MSIAIGALVGALIWILTVCIAAWLWRERLNDPHPEIEDTAEIYESCQSVASAGALFCWLVVGAFVGAAV